METNSDSLGEVIKTVKDLIIEVERKIGSLNCVNKKEM